MDDEEKSFTPDALAQGVCKRKLVEGRDAHRDAG
jgi:hypothetical protein